MDVHDKLDALVELLEGARALPLSGACIVNRSQALTLLEELRELLPEEFHHARVLLAERDAVVEEGRREARRVVAEAESEREQLLGTSAVLAEAQRRAQEAETLAQARAEALREDADAYVDGTLADLEAVLHRTLGTVRRGRVTLRPGDERPGDRDHRPGDRVGDRPGQPVAERRRLG